MLFAIILRAFHSPVNIIITRGCSEELIGKLSVYFNCLYSMAALLGGWPS